MEQILNYYLSIDIGASSGRHILGWIENYRLYTEEVYRFENLPKEKDGHLIWDVDSLFGEIINGLIKCKELNKIPVSVGIDTWAVDYALLDAEDNLIGDVYCYRDSRTEKVIDKVHSLIPQKELYSKTGIQFQPFNTIYQLYEDKLSGRLDKAKSFLMLPDYFHFLLTGVKRNEYTNATSTGLVNAKAKTWDKDIIKAIGLNEDLFKDLAVPLAKVGELTLEIQRQVGFNSSVVLPCTHDTASAVAAVPSVEENTLYISSGTWSLVGVELKEAKTDDESRKLNYTNEGGFNHRFRYLKNIMGLWIIQQIRHELEDKYSFSELVEMAKKSSDFNSIIDVNNEMFLAPKSMIEAVKQCCRESGQMIPEQIGEIAFCVYNSLSKAYNEAFKKLEQITKKNYNKIHIVGGGSKNNFLSELTAKNSGKIIVSGPSEATAIGNIIVQMMADKTIENLTKAREIIKQSFDITEVKI